MSNRLFVRKTRMKAKLQMSDCISMQGNVLIKIDARVSDL